MERNCEPRGSLKRPIRRRWKMNLGTVVGTNGGTFLEDETKLGQVPSMLAIQTIIHYQYRKNYCLFPAYFRCVYALRITNQAK
ncbi:hypothetical protein TNIN_194901 [Trichonephila inaurata madagascariensis]|uniref:Uncharacterized protein n=1 Tax=Trichonephila inaurata madagascariensis TaxID=2747483 RepID=A0A8X6YRK8_9ARAC|nr:hypothetical protein TNIN_194901 [Trichonephila inaurata madagascariensis]